MSDYLEAAITREILALTAARGIGKTICPSEVARAVNVDEWRSLMTRVRRIAASMAKTGQIAIYRKGKIIDPSAMKGVIRLGMLPEP